MSESPYYLGCPVWANPGWKGSLYTKAAARADYLPQYSRVFNTVEVNSTFYALPAPETVRRWSEEVETGFRFCLKFPRAISHEKKLKNAERETSAFLNLLSLLQNADCLGPAFLQLGPDFSARDFSDLEAYLDSLPSGLAYAVEVRHRDYFDEGSNEKRLMQILRAKNIDRVLLDSRPLFSAPATTEAERHSQSRKPRVPVRFEPTRDRPMVRFIGRDDLETLTPWIEEWARLVADWIRAGKKPIVFTHAPDDAFAPALGRKFHIALRKELPDLPKMPTWSGETEPQPARQMKLF